MDGSDGGGGTDNSGSAGGGMDNGNGGADALGGGGTGMDVGSNGGAMGAMGDDFDANGGSYGTTGNSSIDLGNTISAMTASTLNSSTTDVGKGLSFGGSIALSGIGIANGNLATAAAAGISAIGQAVSNSQAIGNIAADVGQGAIGASMGPGSFGTESSTSVSTGGPAASSNDNDAWNQIFSDAAAQGTPYETVATGQGGTAVIGGPTGSTEAQYIAAGTGYIDPSTHTFMLLTSFDNVGYGGGGG